LLQLATKPPGCLLDRVMTVAVSVSAVALAAVAVRHLAAPSRGAVTAAPWYNGSSLFLLVHPACAHCTRSMPFYRVLLAHRAKRAPGVRFLVASRDASQKLEAYLKEHRLEPDASASIPAEAPFPLVLTPTIVSIKPGGVVSRVWTGVLTPENERAVLDEVDWLASLADRP
jgi:hypothetical protein